MKQEKDHTMKQKRKSIKMLEKDNNENKKDGCC